VKNIDGHLILPFAATPRLAQAALAFRHVDL
jgi:hypothetical protein